MTDCTDCPCLSRCYDESNCNFNYKTPLMWTKDQSDKMRNLIYCSDECQLISVAFENKTFKPEKVLATPTNPRHWKRDEKSNN